MEEVVNSSEEKPFKVEITKNTKGYNWVVRVYGDDLDIVKNQVTDLETWAKKTYGDKE
jgi:hypothetical protein